MAANHVLFLFYTVGFYLLILIRKWNPKIFLPWTTRTRVESQRTAPALCLPIGDAGEHGGRYIFCFETTKPM